ncbi:hypothetical protein [Peribacillus sp. SCS-37]|uniref:hypothetical protein n=1 Tax=Paraperibacillus esterisolvens TaxID=3115296 RepID=UPI003906242B
MKFEYRLCGLGWAEGYIEINSLTVDFTVSYFSDGLGEFLNSLMVLNPFCVPDDEVKSETICSWYVEPSGTELIFKRNNDMLNIKVITYEDMDFQINKKLQIEAFVAYDEFLLNVIKQADLLLKKHGIIGYKEAWYEHDFPITSFLKLKNYLLHKKKYPIDTFIEKGCELEKSNLNKDVYLLLNCI